ncbi:hypothetical protein N7444_001685 [Penicillium canescens]|nr:hypothetical protein N7444_001685 [Penicillium canescens]KAJ6174296.1 hypothetical protein N7485_005596 [Penicillium canescens]
MGGRFKGDTKDPAVNVTTWVLLVTIILSVSARLGTKWRLFHKLTADDVLIVASMAFGIAQSIMVNLAVGSGYGKPFKEVSNNQFEDVMKYLYTASLLYIVNLTLSKLSLAVFIRSLTPSARDKFVAHVVKGIIYVWAVVVFFGSAFQCEVPRTWDFWNSRCLDILAWRYFLCGSIIVTDLLIFAQAMVLISSVQTSLQRRLIIAGTFLPRLLVVVATITELAYIKKDTTNPTYTLCEVTIFEVIIQCLSIVTACWGQLNPFLSWIRSNGFKIQGVRDTTTYNYKMSSLRHDQILVTQDWEVSSQSSRAQIILEETRPGNTRERSPD